MKITKKQLKRIIREEYSKLKRRGLIEENIQDTLPGSSWAASAEQHELEEMSPEFYLDQLMKQEYDAGGYSNVDELLDDGALFQELQMDVADRFPQFSPADFEITWYEAGFVDQT